jgi:hypothetical protein
MSSLVFPADDFDKSGKLTAQLGSFWDGAYDDGDFIEILNRARTNEAKQTQRIARENLASVSRATVPIYREEEWLALSIKASERTEGSLIEDGNTFSFSPVVSASSFGLPTSTVFAYPIAQDIKDIHSIVDLRVAPLVLWIKNVDFYLDAVQGLLVFRQDPLELETTDVQLTFDTTGSITEQEAVLWLNEVRLDKAHIYNQFGYIIALKYASSEEYRTLLNHLFDNLVLGNVYDAFVSGLSLLADVPMVQTQGEIVEDISVRTDEILIITDKYVYRCHIDAGIITTVGETLNVNQLLTDTISVTSLHKGTIPSTVLALTIGRGLLVGEDYAGELLFENKTVPTVVTVDPTGLTKIEWEITGAAADVALFWENVHNNGIAADSTLAELMDTRVTKVGQPIASNLPVTVNPLAFLVQNLLRNLILVELNSNTFGRYALGINNANVFRRLVPPQYMVLLVVYVKISDSSPNVPVQAADNVEFFDGAEVVTQEVPSTLIGIESFSFS